MKKTRLDPKNKKVNLVNKKNKKVLNRSIAGWVTEAEGTPNFPGIEEWPCWLFPLLSHLKPVSNLSVTSTKPSVGTETGFPWLCGAGIGVPIFGTIV